MSDSLEKFIKDNKDAFDDLNPSTGLWEKIDGRLTQDQEFLNDSRSYGTWWKVAAAVLLFTTSWLLVDKFSETPESIAITTASNEFIEAENYYINMIDIKRSEIRSQDHVSSELNDDFLKEIDRLDSMYIYLKEEFVRNSSSDQVKDAMIVNLQVRLDILNQQLEILQRLQTLENNEQITI